MIIPSADLCPFCKARFNGTKCENCGLCIGTAKPARKRKEPHVRSLSDYGTEAAGRPALPNASIDDRAILDDEDRPEDEQ